MALIAAIACSMHAANALADQPNDTRLVGCADCDCGQPVCGCEPAACDNACDNNACCDSGCDSGCGLGMGSCLDKLGCGDCCLGDPCQLFGEHCGYSAGGWLQLGYTSDELPEFNTYDDHLQLQQGWLFAEKAIDTECGFDIGGRIDYVYGTDGPNTQAFGTDPRGWDNSWDNGGQYGHALPQLYAEAGYGDVSVKVGHFYTIIGYEVVQATGNFFYSHAYTFNFSEPFTHTGALAKYEGIEDVTLWGGYSLGWDSGFDDNGDAFLGGASMGMTDDLTLTYATIFGRFAEPWTGNALVPQSISGYQHSIVADYNVSDSLKYVFQSDLLETDFADDSNARDSFGINQYLIKSINDCWGVGGRFEWWRVQNGAGPNQDIYALTLGVNHRPHANVIVRPELRWDWDNDGTGLLQDGDDNQTTFGVDTILTF